MDAQNEGVNINGAPQVVADKTRIQTSTDNKSDREGVRKEKRKLMLMTDTKVQRQPAFQLEHDPPHNPGPQPKYDWHMILNHASLEVLTHLDQNT